MSEPGVPSLAQSVDGVADQGRSEEVTLEVVPEVAPEAAREVPVKDDALALAVQLLFSEETGYKVEELEPDYQLDPDLGIDTVKQVEIFQPLPVAPLILDVQAEFVKKATAKTTFTSEDG